MPQIILAGAPTGCWTNLGDEAIFTGMAQSLSAAIPGLELIVVSSSPPGYFRQHGTAEIRYDDLVGLTAAVRESDLVLIGGGSIFFDYWDASAESVLTSAHHGVSLWTSVALLAAAAHVPVMVYGAGVGPLHTSEGELLTRAVFELAHEATVRDSDSARAVHALTAGAVNAVMTADPALAVDIPSPPPLDMPRPIVGVAVREWQAGTNTGHWPVELAGALDAFLAETDGSAVFVPCHRKVAWPLTDDTAAGESVRLSMALVERTRTVSVDLPWRARAALLASMDLVVAVRYHAALFAMAAGVPVIGLAYDPKVGALFSDWGCDELSVSLETVTREDVLARLRRAWAERDAWSNRARRAAAVARDLERDNARRAAALLATGRVAPRAGEATVALSNRAALSARLAALRA